MQQTKKVCSFKKLLKFLNLHALVDQSTILHFKKYCLILRVKANKCKLMITNDNKYFKWNMNFIISTIDFIEYIVLIYYYKLNMYFLFLLELQRM